MIAHVHRNDPAARPDGSLRALQKRWCPGLFFLGHYAALANYCERSQ